MRAALQFPKKHVTLAVLASIVVACATRQPGDPVTPGYNTYSPEQDVAIGREAAAEIRKQVEIVDNKALQDYVSTLGMKLASHPQAGEYPYSFTVINDPSINAFALPGGPIFIHSGLIANSDNEAQLAGVVAHEISHVALRHATSQASKANIIQLPAVLAGAVIGDGSVLAQLGQLGLGLGVNSLMLKYSRGAENEADALGARILADSGYDPMQMAAFFQKLEAEGGSRAPTFLSSHPNPGNRVQNVQAEVAKFPSRQYTAGSGQFSSAKNQVAQLPAPRRPQQQQASALAPAAPSSSFQPLQSRHFRLEYPSNWRAYGDRNSRVATLAPEQGIVRGASGNYSIGYGVVVSYYTPQGRATLQSATSELIAQLQSINAGLKLSGQQRQVSVGGNPGLVTNLSAPSPYGGQERDVLLTVARPEGLFYMVFVAPEKGFDQAEATFQKTLNSIQFAR